jgi:hypothetical protein
MTTWFSENNRLSNNSSSGRCISTAEQRGELRELAEGQSPDGSSGMRRLGRKKGGWDPAQQEAI